MSWLATRSDPLDLIPVAHERLLALVAAVYAGDVDPDTLDLCRRRVETLLAGELMVITGDLTDAQQAALAFAEQFVLDVRGFTEVDNDMLHATFTDAQLTTLTFAVATFDAIARTRAVLGR